LDRIDLFVVMSEPSENDQAEVSSKQMHEAVRDAFVFQKERGQEEFNGKLSESDIEKFCVLSDEATTVFAQGVKRFDLSYRGQNKVIRVARTIADLEQSERIEKAHIIEALSYRKR
jgi:magnesium chelatase family protein